MYQIWGRLRSIELNFGGSRQITNTKVMWVPCYYMIVVENMYMLRTSICLFVGPFITISNIKMFLLGKTSVFGNFAWINQARVDLQYLVSVERLATMIYPRHICNKHEPLWVCEMWTYLIANSFPVIFLWHNTSRNQKWRNSTLSCCYQEHVCLLLVAYKSKPQTCPSSYTVILAL